MRVVNAIAEILRREGVEFITGYPVNPIIEAAAAADIRTVIVRQERVGLHMADAVSRLNSGDKIGVFCMQQGPGTENAFGGVAQAYSESVPILVLPAGYPRRVANVFPNFNASLNFKHVTKVCEPLNRGIFVAEVMSRAFAQLRNGRGGPALIETPADVFGEEVREPLDYKPSFRARTAPDPAAVAEAAKVLAEAENPVIYAGQGVHYAKAWPELKALAELLTIPVCTSLEGKSAFPENHPLALGTGGRTLPKTVHHFLQNADVIFGLGCSFTRTAFGVAMPKGKTIIHSTLDSKDLDKDVPVQYALIGDAQLTLKALLDELENGRFPKAEARQDSVPAEIRSIKEAWLKEWMPKLTSDEKPITPYRVIWDLMHTVDRS
ncbi:MAG: hypothetical protein JRI34_09635, partial [Deltaproteobacteria bacterium]|nr:hypothetical protein [Deltaproteobacteria bacterium]